MESKEAQQQKKRIMKRMTMSVKCMVFYQDKILLLQKKDKEGLRPWEFPGGGLEFGEDFGLAAKREVEEETGLQIQLLDILGLWSFARTESVFLTGIIFLAQANTDAVQLSEEHTDYAWVSVEELAQYPLQDSLRCALERIQPITPEAMRLRDAFCKHFGNQA